LKSQFFQFPKATNFDKVIAKNKILSKAKTTERVKNLFATEVKKILWSHKLSSKTLNIPASKTVLEIQVMTIALNQKKCSLQILQTIDKTIPSPIIFVLQWDNYEQYRACYKRPNIANSNEWVLSEYYVQTEWLAMNNSLLELPVALNLETLYRLLLTRLSPIAIRQNETLDCYFDRLNAMSTTQKHINKLQKQVQLEKQFNRRVDLNKKLNQLQFELEKLK